MQRKIMHGRCVCWTLVYLPHSSCRMIRLICHISICIYIYVYIYRLLGLVRSQQSLWALIPLRVLPRSDHDFLCKANWLSLLLVTVWRHLPTPAQSRLRRANRRRASDILHHCVQVDNARSSMRSLTCNSSLEQVGICMYCHYTAVLFRKTSR